MTITSDEWNIARNDPGVKTSINPWNKSSPEFPGHCCSMFYVRCQYKIGLDIARNDNQILQEIVENSILFQFLKQTGWSWQRLLANSINRKYDVFWCLISENERIKSFSLFISFKLKMYVYLLCARLYFWTIFWVTKKFERNSRARTYS